MVFSSTTTSKGQVTLPIGLREILGIAAGDSIEFYLGLDRSVFMRARNKSPQTFLNSLPSMRSAVFDTDDAAISAAMAEDDDRIRAYESPVGKAAA